MARYQGRQDSHSHTDTHKHTHTKWYRIASWEKERRGVHTLVHTHKMKIKIKKRSRIASLEKERGELQEGARWRAQQTDVSREPLKPNWKAVEEWFELLRKHGSVPPE